LVSLEQTFRQRMRGHYQDGRRKATEALQLENGGGGVLSARRRINIHFT
jgi:hypothetical protein